MVSGATLLDRPQCVIGINVAGSAAVLELASSVISGPRRQEFNVRGGLELRGMTAGTGRLVSRHFIGH